MHEGEKQSLVESRVVRGKQEKLMLLEERMLKASLIRLLEKSRSENSDPQLQTSLEVALGAARKLQADSIIEYKGVTFLLAQHSGFLEHFFLPLTSLVKKRFVSHPREAILLLVSNCFNRADELFETALHNSPKNHAYSNEVTDLFLEKVPLSETNSDGETVRHGFFETLEAILAVAESFDIETSGWMETIKSLVKKQKESLSLVEKLVFEGKQYSVEQSLKLRAGIIAEYSKLLCTILLGHYDQDFFNAFRMKYLREQAEDDLFDMYHDYKSQLNPFLAVLMEEGIIGDFMQYGDDNAAMTRVSENRHSLVSHFLLTVEKEKRIQVTRKLKEVLEKYEFATEEVFENEE